MPKHSPETLNCPKRYAFKTSNRHGAESKRVTYLCRDRHGFMVSHWKCVGFGCKGCPITESPSPAPEAKQELYLRFGKWHESETSRHRGVMTLAGVCAYRIDGYTKGRPVHISEIMLKPTGENDCAFFYDSPASAYPAFLVTGRLVDDFGPTGEVLLKEVKIVEELPREMISPPRKSRLNR